MRNRRRPIMKAEMASMGVNEDVNGSEREIWDM